MVMFLSFVTDMSTQMFLIRTESYHMVVLLVSEYNYDDDMFDKNPEMCQVFDWDGCVLIRYDITIC